MRLAYRKTSPMLRYFLIGCSLAAAQWTFRAINGSGATAPSFAGWDENKGQIADSPAAIPPRGWRDILKRTFTKISENNLLSQAAGVTFYALLAIFPAIAALVSLYGLIADPKTISDHLDTLAGFVPGGGMDLIKDQVTRLTANSSSSLGFGFALGLLTAIWSANQGSKALFSALNAVHAEKEKRGFIRLTLVTLAFTAGALIFLLLSLGVVVVLPVVLNFFGFGGDADLLLRIARWPAILVVVGVFLACLYRFGPSRQEPKWRWVSPGSASAAVAWLVLSVGFSWYVAHFGSYNKTYGSLGAAVGFMTWIWLSTTVMLIGAQINAEAEHQTFRDTTKGASRARGQRGAKMADEMAA